MPQLAQHAARGVAWMSIQTVAGKLVGVAGHIVLAWLLLEKDFGLVSMAYTAVAFPSLFYQLGIREPLLARRDNLREWTAPAIWMSAALGLLSAIGMLIAAPLGAWFFFRDVADPRARTLMQLIFWLAAAAPLNSVANIPLAILQAELRFKLISLITLLSAVLHTLISVALAPKFGVYAFVVPWPIVALLRLVALWGCARITISEVSSPKLSAWRHLIGDGSLLLTARAFGMIVLVGDYMALGFFHSERTVGLYYFAFNLSMQTAMLLATNLDGVLLPILAKLKDDPPRQRQAFLSLMRAWALAAVPICFLQAALAEPVIRLLFQPRWHDAIPALQALSIGMAFRVLALPSQTMLQSQGRFRLFAHLSAITSIAFAIAVTLAAALSPETNAATFVAITAGAYFVVEGPLLVWASLGWTRQGLREASRAFEIPVIAALVSLCLAQLAAMAFIPRDEKLWLAIRIAWITLSGGVIYVVIVRLLARDAWNDLLSRALPMLRRAGRAIRE